MINLGSLGGKYDNLPTAINDNGQIVGWSDLTGDATTHAFLRQNEAMTDLGTLPGDASSFAYAITNKPASFDLLTAEGINDQGVIVGNVFDPAVGTFFAVAATPSRNTSTANQRPAGSGQLTTRATARKAILPATVRAELRSQLGFGLLLGGAR